MPYSRAMRMIVIALTVTLLSSSLFAADAAGEARASETAFAKAFADRNADAFFSFLTDDAVFLGGKSTLSGKARVREVWSQFFADKAAPFSWSPERVVTNAEGTLALSLGPVLDDKGTHISNYSSVWQKQADGSWKIVFDGPGAPVCAPASSPEKK
ncbi:MAG: nuclear transport factor 2 family protein [Acidobacteriota bacterium]